VEHREQAQAKLPAGLLKKRSRTQRSVTRGYEGAPLFIFFREEEDRRSIAKSNSTIDIRF
jgi:hypothetical protein